MVQGASLETEDERNLAAMSTRVITTHDANGRSYVIFATSIEVENTRMGLEDRTTKHSAWTYSAEDKTLTVTRQEQGVYELVDNDDNETIVRSDDPNAP